MKVLDVEWDWGWELGRIMACHYVTLFVAAPPFIVGFLVWLVGWTSWWWVYLAYLCWWAVDRGTPRTGGRRWEAFRRASLWRSFADYFPMRLHAPSAPLDPAQRYLVGYHPHGLVAIGLFLNFGSEATGFSRLFPGLKAFPCTLVGQFSPLLPLRREYVMLTGAVDVSEDSIRHVLAKEGPGSMAVVALGGAREALEAAPGNFRLHLARRRGFCRLALESGAQLVPCYSFGEGALFHQLPNPEGSSLRRFQDWCKPFLGFSLPILQGRGLFNVLYGYVPASVAVDTVVGDPVAVEQILQPTREDVDDLHRRYVKALEELFERNKRRFGVHEDQHLAIV